MYRIYILLLASFTLFSCDKEDQEILFSGGDGTQENPYLVGSADDLDNIRHYAGIRTVYFKQVMDIDLSGFSNGMGWEPIKQFSQNYDGNGYIIYNLTINRPDEGNLGLFADVRVRSHPVFEGNIKNVTLEDVHIIGGYEIGAIAGRNAGTLLNCKSSGKLEALGREGYIGAIGGLVGINDGTIQESYANTQIQLGERFSFFAGGLAGILNVGSVMRSFAQGEIKVSDYEQTRQVAGGLSGYSMPYPGTSVITDCYAKTVITGGNGQTMGGLLGESDGNTIIINSYAVGNISVSGKTTGGLIGAAWGDLSVKDSYWDINTTGQEYSAGSESGIGKTTEQMKIQETFHAWDFENIWTIEEGISYPLLKWQTNDSN